VGEGIGNNRGKEEELKNIVYIQLNA
jgi:hypothetical protein